MPTHTTRCTRCGRRKSSAASTTPDADDVPYHNPFIRRNDATLLGVDANFLRSPKKHGKIFNVAYARNYNGDDGFEVCVVKWVRKHHHCHEQNHFQQMIHISNIAAQIVQQFLTEVDTKGWRLVVNMPTVWRSQEGGGRQRAVLVEPYIGNFRKFNSNSGWVGEGDRTFSKVAQALSHFSYAWSEGKFVLCDLQGGIIGRHQDTIVLADPAINSVRRGAFGCTDNGREYMQNFFKHHKCSSMCARFPKPKDNKIFFRPVMATTTTSESSE